MVRFAEDARRVVAVVVIAEIDRRLAAAQDARSTSTMTSAAAPPTRSRALESAAKALLGEDFRIFPEFGSLPRAG